MAKMQPLKAPINNGHFEAPGKGTTVPCFDFSIVGLFMFHVQFFPRGSLG